MSDTGSLRDQQTELTRLLLFEAARKVISENDPDDFSMQKVAEEAGVSHRTVYRYFPTRQALIDEFANWLESQFGDPRNAPESFGDLSDSIHALFESFDKHAEYYEPAARISGGELRPAGQAARTMRLRELFDREFPDLDPDSADEAFAILRNLGGLQSWFILRDRFGLKDGQPGEAVAWAFRELTRALREGRVPGQGADHASGDDLGKSDNDGGA